MYLSYDEIWSIKIHTYFDPYYTFLKFERPHSISVERRSVENTIMTMHVFQSFFTTKVILFWEGTFEMLNIFLIRR